MTGLRRGLYPDLVLIIGNDVCTPTSDELFVPSEVFEEELANQIADEIHFVAFANGSNASSQSEITEVHPVLSVIRTETEEAGKGYRMTLALPLRLPTPATISKNQSVLTSLNKLCLGKEMTEDDYLLSSYFTGDLNEKVF